MFLLRLVGLNFQTFFPGAINLLSQKIPCLGDSDGRLNRSFVKENVFSKAKIDDFSLCYLFQALHRHFDRFLNS